MNSRESPYSCAVCGTEWITARGFAAHFDRVTHDYYDHRRAAGVEA